MPRFKKIYLEITNRCNLACVFCAPVGRPPTEMSAELCALLLPRLKEFTDHLSLHVLGEPLLHPELKEILALCRSNRLMVNLTTNGTLLPGSAAMLMSSSALRQVYISLHSVMGRETLYDQEAYLSGVLDFSREAAAAGIFVSLRLWDRPRQINGSARWQERVLVRLEEFFSMPEPLSDLADIGHGFQLIDRIFLSRKNLFEWPAMAGEDRGGRGFCLALRDQVAILADGRVVPCCLDAGGEMSLGNIWSNSLKEIVNGERARSIRDGFKQRRMVEELCKRCSYRERF